MRVLRIAAVYRGGIDHGAAMAQCSTRTWARSPRQACARESFARSAAGTLHALIARPRRPGANAGGLYGIFLPLLEEELLQ
jgi:hypothetical protein